MKNWLRKQFYRSHNAKVQKAINIEIYMHSPVMGVNLEEDMRHDGRIDALEAKLK